MRQRGLTATLMALERWGRKHLRGWRWSRSRYVAIALITVILTLGLFTPTSAIEGTRAGRPPLAQGNSAAQLAQAEKQKAQIQSEQAALPDPAELEARLEVLKKGSGR